MSVQIRRRRESAAFLSTFVGAQGELLVDTTNNRVQVHDGATPGGFAAAKLSEVVTNGRTAIADTNYTALVSDRTIAITAITAARTIMLPPAASYPTGTALTIVDEAGAASGTNTITLARSGPDTINGAASAAINAAFGYLAIESDGVSRWTIIDQLPAGAASTTTRTSVSDTNYTALATDRLVAFTALTAARTLTLPAAAAYPTGTVLTVTDETGGASSLNTISISRAGSDTVNGTSSSVISNAYGFVSLESNGVSKWTVLAQTVVATPRSGVRQTVQSGPVSSKVPSFLPVTSASLTLTAQNISSTTPLIVAAAQGFGVTGPIDSVAQLVANPSWTCAANATSYLYVNAQVGTTGSTTLQPIYQCGGTIATTSGQFTFDTQAMIGYLGNGSVAAPTPLVFVGEAVAAASAVTSAIAYAYDGIWDSGWTATLPAVASAQSLTHNVGLDQLVGVLTAACTTADTGSGFAVGDTSTGILSGNLASSSTYYTPVTIAVGRLAASFVAAQAYAFPKKSTGVVTAITTNSNFKWRVTVKRPW